MEITIRYQYGQMMIDCKRFLRIFETSTAGSCGPCGGWIPKNLRLGLRFSASELHLVAFSTCCQLPFAASRVM